MTRRYGLRDTPPFAKQMICRAGKFLCNIQCLSLSYRYLTSAYCCMNNFSVRWYQLYINAPNIYMQILSQKPHICVKNIGIHRELRFSQHLWPNTYPIWTQPSPNCVHIAVTILASNPPKDLSKCYAIVEILTPDSEPSVWPSTNLHNREFLQWPPPWNLCISL